MLTAVVLQTVPTTTAPSTVLKTLLIDAVDPDEIVIVKSISGLSPTPVTQFTGDYARDGGYYQGRRVGKRNPVFNLILNPDYVRDIAVSDIREMVYQWFLEPTLGSDGLMVVLKDDRRVDRFLIGYTETIDPDIFSQDTSAPISVVCPDGYIRSVVPVEMIDSTGSINSMIINYDGSAATGLEVWVKVMTATNVVNIELNDTKMTLTKATNFAVNDIIKINTSPGERFIRLNDIDNMALLTSGPKWLQLDRPVNTIKVHGAVDADGKVSLSRYWYRSAWWGV